MISYRIHATFVIDAESAEDAEEAVRSAHLDDDLAPRWTLTTAFAERAEEPTS